MARDTTNNPTPEKSPRPKGAGWLSKLRPGVRDADARKTVETPDNLWVKCPETGEMIYRADLEKAHWVTPAGFHMRIGPEARFKATFDDGRFERIAAPKGAEDPLTFTDQKPYRERLDAARKSTGETDAIALAEGVIKEVKAVVAVQDFAFLGGSLGVAAGEGFIAGATAALERQAPYVIFTASGGARMQEGTLSLMQMARTTLAIQDLKRERLPYVVVLTDPTTGGVTASYAMLGDVQFAEPNALIGFTGPRIIEQTIRESLPEGFQRAEYLVDKGMVDQVVARKDLPERLGSVLRILMAACTAKAA